MQACVTPYTRLSYPQRTQNLNNLKDVVNMRFEFYGFPLRLEPAAGSMIRAVGIVND